MKRSTTIKLAKALKVNPQIFIAPEGVDVWSQFNAALLKMCNDFVSNIRRDALEEFLRERATELVTQLFDEEIVAVIESSTSWKRAKLRLI